MHSPRRVSIVIPVFRDGDRAITLVRALRDLPRDGSEASEIIVVDDGSGDGTAEALSAAVGDITRIVPLPANVGRSMARNAGAGLASGELILFMDCDCLPASPTLLQSHLAAWDDDVAATIGHVVGDGQGFWHRYQAKSSERRRRQHAAGIPYSGSSQNLMVRRSAFQACGGFDAAYRTYGFEDRDLQIRLAGHGEIRWADGATVRHMDRLSLAAVSRKMAEAGGQAADVFRARHPDAYRLLGYGALDAHLRPWLRLPAGLAALLAPAAARGVDILLDRPWLPFSLKSLMVRSITAASYLSGCRPK